MRPVEVEWVDSMILNCGEWGESKDYEEVFGDMTHHACGYLLSANAQGIILALSIYQQTEAQPERAACAMLIPRGAILSIKDLFASKEDAGVYRTAKETRE